MKAVIIPLLHYTICVIFLPVLKYHHWWRYRGLYYVCVLRCGSDRFDVQQIKLLVIIITSNDVLILLLYVRFHYHIQLAGYCYVYAHNTRVLTWYVVFCLYSYFKRSLQEFQQRVIVLPFYNAIGLPHYGHIFHLVRF